MNATKIPSQTIKAIASRIDQMRELRAAKDAIEAERKRLQGEVIEFYEAHDVTTLDLEMPDGIVAKATVVQASSTVLDEAGIQAAVGETVWNEITRRVIDTALLEDAVARGRVHPNVLVENSTDVPKAPFVKITEKKGAK